MQLNNELFLCLLLISNILRNDWYDMFTTNFQGLVYTGCLDGLIRAYEPQTPDPHHTLEGHTGAVASIFVSANKVSSKTLLT